MNDLSVTFDTPLPLAIGGVIGALAVIVWLLRRPMMPKWTAALLALGLVMLVLACGTPKLSWPRVGTVAVMVDVSPSTRFASYREPGVLREQVERLLGDVPYRVYHFGSSNALHGLEDAVVEQPAERTVFEPPRADAIVLWSDGQFELPPSAPPTYAIVDPRLDDADDGAVRALEWRGQEIVARVTTGASARQLAWSDQQGAPTVTVPARASLVLAAQSDQITPITAALDRTDAWPENDQLTIAPPAPQQFTRWWVGTSPPDESWTQRAPEALPTEASAYLEPSVIVLDNQAADAFSGAQLDRLSQYVRDLGGSVVILGGDRAFASGGYPGTTLELLSPLASVPPQPTAHWVLLTDASGSMSGRGEGGEGGTRWQHATRALVDLVRRLPPDDLVSVGGFSNELTWWSTGRSASETAQMTLPPSDASPRGPTNLESALRAIATSSDPSLETRAIVLTDAQAEIDDPAGLAAQLRDARVTLYVLATADVPVESPLRDVVRITEGQIVSEPDPQSWAEAARALGRTSLRDLLRSDAIGVSFVAPLSNLPPRTVERWNRVWLKEQASLFAQADGNGAPVPLAARHQVGLGTVTAFAAQPTPSELTALIDRVEQSPRDPRLSVRWEAGPLLGVSVDAQTAEGFLNDLNISLTLLDATSPQAQSVPLRQTAPGHYEFVMSAPRQPVIAALVVEGRVVERRALAGRYAPEFEVIGNNRDALRSLAKRTGGEMVDTTANGPIRFRWPTREVPITSPLLVTGAALLMLGLAWWRWR